MAVSQEEKERILHAFSEECAERIIGEVDAKGINKEFNVELSKLILSFGEPVWNKMEESLTTGIYKMVKSRRVVPTGI